MHALLSGFAPIWTLTAIGYAVARGGLLGPAAEDVLGRFVFHVAMPAALFMMVSRARLGSFVNPSMLAFAAGTALASGVGFVVARRSFGRGTAEQAISSMASGYVNSANLGIPVAVQVLGDASFVAQIILFQVLFVSPVILTLLDRGADPSNTHWKAGFRRMPTMPVRNPIIMASLLGLLVSATGVRPPLALAHSLDLLGAAAVPTALITLGLSLHGRPDTAAAEERSGVPGSRSEVATVVALKTLLQPLIAFAVGGPLLLDLPEPQLLAVVLCSALPTAQNAFIYARQYGLDTTLARNAVVASTVVSMATLSFATWALGPSRG
ncbi:AEC family transporter [Streptomyces sp. NBC_01433]|uniref:AEC family transporter n=1 Tax=Streptomyces sp. NBC_01433 TaxID=2903864 RepID=UPI00225C13EC|nr:AEC family transporter [Streptomyces sp. NBC_01433]MCX4677514.1 AEC family transporter [Streptomyces sp. NBC_01433]